MWESHTGTKDEPETFTNYTDKDHRAIFGSAIAVCIDTLAQTRTLEPWEQCTLNERE